jgi:uncharacterized membrane protein YdjX (TVP38/TMEM64 family)
LLDPTPPPRRLRHSRILALVAVLAALAAAQHFGVFRALEDPAGLARTLVELGPWGWAAFIVAYTVMQPFGVPGTVFVLAAPLIWPWPVAFALSMTGTMAASVVGFSFARFVARDWVAARVPARFRRYDEALERRAFATVFLLRLVFWMPQVLHAFFGVSRVRFSTHFWGSLAGYLLPILLCSYFGKSLFDAVKSAPPALWVVLGTTVVVAATAAWAVRWRCASVAARRA